MRDHGFEELGQIAEQESMYSRLQRAERRRRRRARLAGSIARYRALLPPRH